MDNEIISYIEMCNREGLSLQRGMNFDVGRGYSVILMSVQKNAPYHDRFEDESTILYQGHDQARSSKLQDPKIVDQPLETPRGTPTENGKFFRAAQEFKVGEINPSKVRVYEKIRNGIWSYNGLFDLVDAWQEQDRYRRIIRFKLVVSENQSPESSRRADIPRRRLIPTSVKLEVWQRDGGRCVKCGETTELHFDHDFPFSRGGTSVSSANVQLLCARHNLSKGAKIL